MEKLDPAFDAIGGDGVVTIALESGRKINIDRAVDIGFEDFNNIKFVNLRLFVRNGNFCRSFKPSSFDNGYPCWNQILNVPVHVYPKKTHPFNSLVFTIEIFHIVPTEKKTNEVIGSLVLHLYDIIPLNQFEDLFYFYQKNRLGKPIGCVSMTVKFTYGTFGYGYSMQIHEQSLQAKSENKNILFPRITPPSFGKDFIYKSVKKDTADIIDENRQLERKYSDSIEYLFNLEKKDPSKTEQKNVESRKSRLNRLRDLVLSEQSETTSFSLDENYYIRAEQTEMLKRFLAPKK